MINAFFIQSLSGMRHSLYFNEVSQRRIWPNDYVRWPVDKDVSISSIRDRSGANSPTKKGWKAWLALEGHEPSALIP